MSNEDNQNGVPTGAPGKTIDLQGVASFAGLVELLAQELGTNPGKMQGNLPNGPNSFDQLVGEINMNNQGYLRRLTLMAQPGAPLSMRIHAAWGGNQSEPNAAPVGGVNAYYHLPATVEQIIPQGRALARYIEDIFAVMDRMVTLGQSHKLATMAVSAAELQAFESSEGEKLVQQAVPKNAANFDPDGF